MHAKSEGLAPRSDHKMRRNKGKRLIALASGKVIAVATTARITNLIKGCTGKTCNGTLTRSNTTGWTMYTV